MLSSINTKIALSSIILGGMTAGVMSVSPATAQTEEHDLTIQKNVLNVTEGETEFAAITDAKEGDTVRFQVVITTTGTAPQTNITIRDPLPRRLTFLSGTDLTNVNVGSLNAGETRTFTFEALVTGSSATTIVNRAQVNSNEVSTKSDTAKVKVAKTQRGLTIEKAVLNVTNGETEFSDITDADEGDTVRFQITFTTTGTGTQTNVIVRDHLPSRLLFLSGDNLAGGLNVGNLDPDQTRTYTFDARVTGSSAVTVVNRVQVRSDQVSNKAAIAKVRVARTVRGFILDKQVLNVTKGETVFVDTTTADEGDTVRFRIEIETTGTASQTGVIVHDYMPRRLVFLSGDNLTGGLNAGDMDSGATRTYTFDARVTGATGGALLNRVQVRSDQVSSKTTTAKVKLNKTRRGFTIEKLVLNVTKGETVFATTTNADEGDIVRFQTVFTTTGTASQTDVIVRDFLPSRLVFLSGDNFTGGLNVGNLDPGATRTYTFDARVTGSSSTTLVNRAQVRSDEVSAKSDTAQVKVAKTITE